MRENLANITRKNVGRLLAIVLDGKVISAPSIREPIPGGSGIISGEFTVQAVQDLALLLRAGALPAPLNILEERTVGPGLGQDSIDAGQIASIIGIVLVTIFMIVVYGRFGIMADVAFVSEPCAYPRRVIALAGNPHVTWHRWHRPHDRHGR